MSVMIDEQQARPTQGRVELSGERQAELKEELRAEFRAQLDEVEARAEVPVRAELLASIDKIGLV